MFSFPFHGFIKIQRIDAQRNELYRYKDKKKLSLNLQIFQKPFCSDDFKLNILKCWLSAAESYSRGECVGGRGKAAGRAARGRVSLPAGAMTHCPAGARSRT